jgi:PadR family transcriptional regulator PadR
MSLENTQAQMRKGILEYCILSILDKKEAYPSEILETLKDAKLIVVEGTLYPLLTRLKNMELLSYRWEESQSGPPRKYFTLTKMGKAFLEELDNTWSELSEAVNKITNISTK